MHGDKILVSAVGALSDGSTAQGVLDRVCGVVLFCARVVYGLLTTMCWGTQGQADVIFVGRQFQSDPALVWTMAE